MFTCIREWLLKPLFEEMYQMTTTLQQLDDAITTLTTATGKLVTDVQALLDKINASPAAPDFSTELDTVNAAITSLQTADANANAVLNPPTP